MIKKCFLPELRPELEGCGENVAISTSFDAEAERAAKEKLIEEEQRKMQESILALFNKREQNKAEREAKEMEAKSQLQKDIENVSIDKEVEQKVREDLGQIKDEQDKKKVEVPICNYGPGCRCNPEIKEDIFDHRIPNINNEK